MARLSWPGWLVTYRNDLSDCLTVTHPSTNRARRRLTSLIGHNVLTTRLSRHLFLCRSVILFGFSFVLCRSDARGSEVSFETERNARTVLEQWFDRCLADVLERTLHQVRWLQPLYVTYVTRRVDISYVCCFSLTIASQTVTYLY